MRFSKVAILIPLVLAMSKDTNKEVQTNNIEETTPRNESIARKRESKLKQYVKKLDFTSHLSYHNQTANVQQAIDGLRNIPLPELPPQNNSNKEAEGDSNRKTVVIVTLGTRGDIQPYIPLCRALEKDGVNCYIASHLAYSGFAKENNIKYIPLPGTDEDIKQTMKDVAGGITSSKSIMASLRAEKQQYLRDLAVKGCEGIVAVRPDVLLSVSWYWQARDIAEGLDIPFINLQVFPSARNSEIAHFSMENRMDYRYLLPSLRQDMNKRSYDVMNTAWMYTADGPTEEVRKMLGLKSKSVSERVKDRRNDPQIYGFSPTLLNLDEWKRRGNVHIVGWFPSTTTTAPKPGVNAIWDRVNQFTKSTKRIIYMGFGSMEIGDYDMIYLKELAHQIARSHNVRVFFHLGGAGTVSSNNKPEPIMYHVPKYGVHPDVLIMKGHVQHDWFFDRLSLAISHGGSGTVYTTLRAGVPALIKPFFGDQYTWCDAVRMKKVGECVRSFDKLGEAINVLMTPTNSGSNHTQLSDIEVEAKQMKIAINEEDKTSVNKFKEALQVEVARWENSAASRKKINFTELHYSSSAKSVPNPFRLILDNVPYLGN